jgi:RNA polymerase sigma-70 factor (ECF subfamily)
LLGSARQRAWTEQLLDAQDGDIERFGTLFEEMKPVLRTRLRSCSWTRNLGTEEVEDALNEAALNGLQHLHTFDATRGSALWWLWSITRNSAVSTLRRRGRYVALDLTALEAAGQGKGSDHTDPAVLAAAREEAALVERRLAAALDGAGPVARRVWEMRFAGLPYAQIAAELDLPVGTVATCIHRLRKESRVASR